MLNFPKKEERKNERKEGEKKEKRRADGKEGERKKERRDRMEWFIGKGEDSV